MFHIFYLNRDLQIEENCENAVAMAHFFQDECHSSLYELGEHRFKKIVEITFLEPIDHNASLRESDKLQKAWKEKHYPQYHSFLPSKKLCNLINARSKRKIDNCWTRSYGDDDYPAYRYFPIAMQDGNVFFDYSLSKAKNVFVSLVLTKEEFLAINPNVELGD